MIKRYLPILEYLHKLSPHHQKKFILNADSNVLKILSEICHNLNKNTLKLSENDISLLKPYRKDILFLCSKRRSLADRRKTLQKGVFHDIGSAQIKAF